MSSSSGLRKKRHQRPPKYPNRLTIIDPEGQLQESQNKHNIGRHKHVQVCSHHFMNDLKRLKESGNNQTLKQMTDSASTAIRNVLSNPKKASTSSYRRAQQLEELANNPTTDINKWSSVCGSIPHESFYPSYLPQYMQQQTNNPELVAVGERKERIQKQARALYRAQNKAWREQHPDKKYVFETYVDANGDPVCGTDEQFAYKVGDFALIRNKAMNRVPVWKKVGGVYKPFCKLPRDLQNQGFYEFLQKIASDPRVPPETRDKYKQLVQTLAKPEVAKDLLLGSSIIKTYWSDDVYTSMLAKIRKNHPDIQEKTDPKTGLLYFQVRRSKPVQEPVPGVPGLTIEMNRPWRIHNLGVSKTDLSASLAALHKQAMLQKKK